jgi:hypothetical protein
MLYLLYSTGLVHFWVVCLELVSSGIMIQVLALSFLLVFYSILKYIRYWTLVQGQGKQVILQGTNLMHIVRCTDDEDPEESPPDPLDNLEEAVDGKRGSQSIETYGRSLQTTIDRRL